MNSRLRKRLQILAKSFEIFTADVIYDRASGRGAFAYACFLRSLSWLFKSIVKTRFFLYQKRILHDNHLGCQVIVVGNITVGGTGKTPVVEILAKTLRQRGRRVAILSRGYKSKKEPTYKKIWRSISHQEPEPPKVVSDGNAVLLNSEIAGDEPYMLARNLPGVAVIVDKDRVKAGTYAISKFKVDTLLLDDGFQYFKLKDHQQILLIDRNNPFGNQSLLPRGILREPISHIKRASYIFFTKSNGIRDHALEALVRKYKKDAEIIECTHKPKYIEILDGSEQHPLSFLKDKKIAAFSAIAVPESFEKFLTDLGSQLIHKERFLDHHRFHEWEIKELFKNAQAHGAEFLVTTEKDAVRLDPHMECPLPIYFLRVEIEILSGFEDFEEAVSRICPLRKHPQANAHKSEP